MHFAVLVGIPVSEFIWNGDKGLVLYSFSHNK